MSIENRPGPRPHRNHNYAIGTDTLPSGKVRARARGRKRNTRTFPPGTRHLDAAAILAHEIEGERFSHVAEISRNTDGTKADFAAYVAAAPTEGN